MKPNKLVSMIGLCRKAGKTVCGTPLVCLALQKREKPCLVLLAENASPGTQKKIRNKTAFYGVPYILVPVTTEALAHAVGKTGEVAAIAVTDNNLASAILHASESTGKDGAESRAPMQ